MKHNFKPHKCEIIMLMGEKWVRHKLKWQVMKSFCHFRKQSERLGSIVVCDAFATNSSLNFLLTKRQFVFTIQENIKISSSYSVWNELCLSIIITIIIINAINDYTFYDGKISAWMISRKCSHRNKFIFKLFNEICNNQPVDLPLTK